MTVLANYSPKFRPLLVILKLCASNLILLEPCNISFLPGVYFIDYLLLNGRIFANIGLYKN